MPNFIVIENSKPGPITHTVHLAKTDAKGAVLKDVRGNQRVEAISVTFPRGMYDGEVKKPGHEIQRYGLAEVTPEWLDAAMEDPCFAAHFEKGTLRVRQAPVAKRPAAPAPEQKPPAA